jgi:hypothetical protein
MQKGEKAKTKVIRRVHALAKELWGEEKISGVPAYIFWTRVWAKLRYGIEKRRDLNIIQWMELERWLKALKNRSKGGSDQRWQLSRQSTKTPTM